MRNTIPSNSALLTQVGSPGPQRLMRRKPMWSLGLLCAALLALSACGGSSEGESEGAGSATTSTEVAAVTTTVAPTTTEAPTTEVSSTEKESGDAQSGETVPVVFANDFGTSVAPILATHCASCHQKGGAGTAHWTLSTADDAAHEAIGIAAAVGSGWMPPWPAGHESVAFQDDLSLSEDEIAAVVDWVKAGAELDVDPTTPIEAAPQVRLANIDQSIAPAVAYAGSPAQTDDYRCQIYDPEIDEATALIGYDFVPDQGAVVHHAIGFLIDGEQAQAAADRDASEDGAGWTCYGGSGLHDDQMLIGWAPGQDASNFPEGSGYVLEPGDFFVIQIHYHYETAAPADASELHLDLGSVDDLTSEILVRQYVAPVEIPCATTESGPLCDRDAAMADAIERFGTGGVRADQINGLCGVTPADFAHMTDGIATSTCDLPIYGFGEIISVLGHEHELGASFRMTLNPGKSDERILLDIPVWDFDWQYNYAPVEPIVVSSGDTVRLECSWDRSLAKPGIEPAYILWADGTNDEMCFATIVTRS